MCLSAARVKKCRHDSGALAASRRITRGHYHTGLEATIQGYGFLIARRPIPHCCRFTEQPAILRRLIRISLITIAERQCAGHSFFSKQRSRAKMPMLSRSLHCWKWGETGRIDRRTAQGAVYYPYAFHSGDIFVVVRTSMPPESLGLTLQAAVRQVDPDLPVNDVRTMEARVTDSLLLDVHRRSLRLILSDSPAGCCHRSYGVLSYLSNSGRREIGVRHGAGATAWTDSATSFLLLALRLLGLWCDARGVGACLTGRAMQTLLFRVPAFNLAILSGVTGVMGLVSIIACLLPSYRAARTSISRSYPAA